MVGLVLCVYVMVAFDRGRKVLGQNHSRATKSQAIVALSALLPSYWS